MQRARDLVELHYGVKMSHMHGEDSGLKQAREEINGVLRAMSKSTNVASARSK